MSRRTHALLATAAAFGIATVVIVTAPGAGAESQSPWVAVRQATTQFHSIPAAEAANYHKFLACFDMPGMGGMGQHWANTDLIDTTVDATHPEVLVYEPKDGKYQLVAVEYVVPQGAPYSDTNKPSLFGVDFRRNDTLGIWALHAWIWRGNSTGVNEDFNPNVRMCPTT